MWSGPDGPISPWRVPIRRRRCGVAQLSDTLCLTCYADRLVYARLLSSHGDLRQAGRLLEERLYSLLSPLGDAVSRRTGWRRRATRGSPHGNGGVRARGEHVGARRPIASARGRARPASTGADGRAGPIHGGDLVCPLARRNNCVARSRCAHRNSTLSRAQRRRERDGQRLASQMLPPRWLS